MAMGDQDNVLTAKPKAETNTGQWLLLMNLLHSDVYNFYQRKKNLRLCVVGKRKTTVASATEKHPVSMKSAQPDKSKEIVEQTKEVKDEEKDFIVRCV